LVGSGVQIPATSFMSQLHLWSGSYVRGHMLNSKLHGPGIDKNLVPISSTFNSAMKNGVEEKLKELVTSQNLVVSYEIEPTGWGRYPGTCKGQSIEAALPTHFNMHIRPMKLKQQGIDGLNPDNWELANAGNHDYSQAHELPGAGSTRFNESSPPHLL